MANTSKKNASKEDLTGSNKKWARETEKIRKIQISLDFGDAADTLLRTLAAREHKAPSAMIREIVGMPSNPPKRARIGVSFNDEELTDLGKRYNVDPQDKAMLRRKLIEEVSAVLSSTEFSETYSDVDEIPENLVGQGFDVKRSETSSPPSKSKNKRSAMPRDAIQELQNASDGIYQRFQRALAKRSDEHET